MAGALHDEQTIFAQLRAKLPVYMVPQTILFRDELPLNDNGKIDPKRLMDELARPR